MTAMKLAFILFTLSPLLGAYHARHLHDGFIYQSFDRRPAEIQMVAPSRGQFINLTHISAPPSPKPDNYDRDDPTTPPSPDPNEGDYQGMYGRDEPIAPNLPEPADPTRPTVEVHLPI